MEEKEWTEEIFPGIHRIGNDASDVGGNQAVLIEKDDHIYLIFAEGCDYGAWLGARYKLTIQEKERVMNWKEGSYELIEWLKEKDPH